MQIDAYSFPEDRHYWLRDDMWCLHVRRDVDDTVTIGITSFGLHLSGDIFMCRPKRVGTAVKQGETMGVVELSKSVVTIKSPATGEIIEVNPRLAAEPEIIQQDPYGEGWLARMRATRWIDDCAALAHGVDLNAAMLERIRLEPAA